MKSLFLPLFALALSTGAFASSCPSSLLVKKEGAKTFFSQDLKTKYSQKELTKFGCSPKTQVMSQNDTLKLLKSEYEARVAKLKG